MAALNPEMPRDGRVETVAVTRNQGVTILIEALLKGNGIPVFVSGAEAAHALGGVLRTRMLVPAEHADRARELLSAEVDAEDFEAINPAPVEPND